MVLVEFAVGFAHTLRTSLYEICVCERVFLKRTLLRCDCDQMHPPRDMADVRVISYNDTLA